jgi:hypothetical protein
MSGSQRQRLPARQRLARRRLTATRSDLRCRAQVTRPPCARTSGRRQRLALRKRSRTGLGNGSNPGANPNGINIRPQVAMNKPPWEIQCKMHPPGTGCTSPGFECPVGLHPISLAGFPGDVIPEQKAKFGIPTINKLKQTKAS